MLKPIGVIVLAAGASTRMGTPKQLMPYYWGRSLLHHIVEVAVSSVCHPIVVVLGAYAELIEPEVNRLPIQAIKNWQWHEGMSSSIRVGIEALTNSAEKIEAVVLVLCDQPFVSTQIINHLVEVYNSTGKLIVASEYAGTLGVPALFSHALFSELVTLKGGSGAKQVIRKHVHEVFSIPFPQGAIDLDTPQDYKQFQSLMN